MSYAYPPSSSGPPAAAPPPPTKPLPKIPGARFPVYSIDFVAEASGKRIATTKRRIRWRFGFPNAEALQKGMTGTACRGYEHEVTITWSVTSGKRQIIMDGQEVHFSVGRSGRLDFTWAMKGNHVLKVLAYATPPINAPVNFRQYDLFVDGLSFFDMPKVYEIGLSGPPQAQSRVPGDMSHYHIGSIDREEQELQRAIAESIAESRRHLESNNKRTTDGIDDTSSGFGYGNYAAPSPGPTDVAATTDLLEFTAPTVETVPTTPYAPASAPPPNVYVGAAPAPFLSPVSMASVPPPASQAPPPTYASPGGYSAPPPIAPAQYPVQQQLALPTAQPTAYPGAPAPASYPAAPPPPPAYLGAQPPQLINTQQPPQLINTQQPPAPATGNLLPPFVGDQPLPPPDDPFAPKPPSKNEILSSIMDAYAASSNAPPSTPMGSGVPPQPNFQTPAPVSAPHPSTPATAPGGQPLSMNAPLAITSEEDAAAEPKDDVDKAMKNLVNFDDINEPAEKELKLTMLAPEAAKPKDQGKSTPIPPVGQNMVGTAASLNQIQSVKPERAPTDPSSIMKPPPQLFTAGVAAAGALVVHGQGPPPIQSGFGVGYGPPPQMYPGQY